MHTHPESPEPTVGGKRNQGGSREVGKILGQPRQHAFPFLAGEGLVPNAQSSHRPCPGEGAHQASVPPGPGLALGEQRSVGSRGSQPPALTTDGSQVSDTSGLKARSGHTQWGQLTNIRCVADVRCQSSCLHNYVGQGDGLLRACHGRDHLSVVNKDKRNSSVELPSSPGLGHAGLVLCPCRMAGRRLSSPPRDSLL